MLCYSGSALYFVRVFIEVFCNGQSVPKVVGVSEHILFAHYVLRLILCLIVSPVFVCAVLYLVSRWVVT